jgi:dTDP-4-dehydrorhamnose reductase
MKIGITGASGMLGTALVSHLSKIHKIFATSRSKGLEGKNIKWSFFDLTDTMLLNEWLKAVKLDLIIHCAAIINVDDCEDDIELAKKLHIETTKVIVNYLNINNGRLIYISTDSVFDGENQSAYSETDTVNPLNIYAMTKFLGEKSAQQMCNSLILRVNIVGWTQGESASFFEWILRGLIDKVPLNLFHDVYFSPLHVDDLSLIIEKIIDKPIFGLYHCASNDSISKYGFGKKVAEIFCLPDSNINKISVEGVKFKANRPKNMALNIEKISFALGCDFPSIIDAIKLMKDQHNKNGDLLNYKK